MENLAWIIPVLGISVVIVIWYVRSYLPEKKEAQEKAAFGQLLADCVKLTGQISRRLENKQIAAQYAGRSGELLPTVERIRKQSAEGEYHWDIGLKVLGELRPALEKLNIDTAASMTRLSTAQKEKANKV